MIWQDQLMILFYIWLMIRYQYIFFLITNIVYSRYQKNIQVMFCVLFLISMMSLLCFNIVDPVGLASLLKKHWQFWIISKDSWDVLIIFHVFSLINLFFENQSFGILSLKGNITSYWYICGIFLLGVCLYVISLADDWIRKFTTIIHILHNLLIFQIFL